MWATIICGIALFIGGFLAGSEYGYNEALKWEKPTPENGVLSQGEIEVENSLLECQQENEVFSQVEVMVDELKNNVDIVNQKNETLYTLLEFLYTHLGVFGICLCSILLFLVFKYIRK